MDEPTLNCIWASLIGFSGIQNYKTGAYEGEKGIYWGHQGSYRRVGMNMMKTH